MMFRRIRNLSKGDPDEMNGREEMFWRFILRSKYIYSAARAEISQSRSNSAANIIRLQCPPHGPAGAYDKTKSDRTVDAAKADPTRLSSERRTYSAVNDAA